MRSVHDRVFRMPLGDGSGGAPSAGGTPTPKLPNAFTPTPGAAGAGGAGGPGPGVGTGGGASGGAATPAAPAGEAKPKIHAFSQALGGKKHSENWKRKTNLTGAGATHVRSFHCKLNPESLEYMDQQINEWLDTHPDYEVKMVSSAVGEWTGKIKEPALIVTVWV